MSVSISNVYLRSGITGKLVEAQLYDSILPKHLDDHENDWQSHIPSKEEHSHWDWRDKHSSIANELRFQSFALECDGMTQGLMIVNTIKRCRISSQANKHLVYVEYLEAAPWNRTKVDVPQFRGVGTVMIAAAVHLSEEEGNDGRVGLHSLPQADNFYRTKCGMTDLGPDASYPSQLRYFEMTEAQAASFLK